MSSSDSTEDDLERAARLLAGFAVAGARETGRLVARGVRLWAEQLQMVERAGLRQLRDRMDLLAPPRENPAAITEVSASDAMAELLEKAVEQTSREGREAFYHSLIVELVPDEARILALLADGETAALVHIDTRAPGAARRRILANATLLAGRASLSVPDMARAYVTKLLTLGLLEVGPEEPDLAKDYEILLAESDVRAALAAGGINRVPARAVRRSLRLSALGEELWSACRREP